MEHCLKHILQHLDHVRLNESLSQSEVNRLAGQIVPFRSDGVVILLVKHGTLKLTIDYNDYVLTKYDMFIVLPEHIMQKIEAQDNFEGLVLLVKKEFLENVMTLLNKGLYCPGYTKIRLFPHCNLHVDEFNVISSSILIVKDKILAQNKTSQYEVIKCAVLIVLLECGNIMETISSQPLATSRQEQILNAFLELLKDNCVKEHKVEFYANKLFVTPQYLSLVLKNTSGKTAYQWIVDGIITESKILLKNVDSTIQQISENLYFPDSSSFSKFFKKQTGVSPFKYRNMNSEAQLLF